ncbi:unnamed protein product [Pieris brassicae]|uniref:Uncharacterized protein n=1 Tax=Pieris brassicae TaxID=7116 RepID=A0A9P0TZJ1_PIEBR|nr:unnamed protein product [Pieris brassicae]
MSPAGNAIIIGHLARVCLQRNPNLRYKAPIPNSHQLEEPHDSDNDDWNNINMISAERTEKFMISVQIENAKLKMEFDTGATLT